MLEPHVRMSVFVKDPGSHIPVAVREYANGGVVPVDFDDLPIAVGKGAMSWITEGIADRLRGCRGRRIVFGIERLKFRLPGVKVHHILAKTRRIFDPGNIGDGVHVG